MFSYLYVPMSRITEILLNNICLWIWSGYQLGYNSVVEGKRNINHQQIASAHNYRLRNHLQYNRRHILSTITTTTKRPKTFKLIIILKFSSSRSKSRSNGKFYLNFINQFINNNDFSFVWCCVLSNMKNKIYILF